jgi:hypothetical protein
MKIISIGSSNLCRSALRLERFYYRDLKEPPHHDHTRITPAILITAIQLASDGNYVSAL